MYICSINNQSHTWPVRLVSNNLQNMGCVCRPGYAPLFYFMSSSWSRYASKSISDFTGRHRWEHGEWDHYGDYIYREDVCRCGCIRRVVVTDDADEVIEFYDLNDSVHLSTPPCIIKNFLSVTIVADPTHVDVTPRCKFEIHKPDKIDYFDVYNY